MHVIVTTLNSCAALLLWTQKLSNIQYVLGNGLFLRVKSLYLWVLNTSLDRLIVLKFQRYVFIKLIINSIHLDQKFEQSSHITILIFIDCNSVKH